MKTDANQFHVPYASVIRDPNTMTRKRLSDDSSYPPLAQEPVEMQCGKSNKLPRFEYVTQISAGTSAAAPTHHQLISYCETVDFHNEKGQRIYLTDSESSEFVNIMLQENLLSVQAPNGHGGVSGDGHHCGTELIELNSSELLDLDVKRSGGGGNDEENGVVTYMHNSANEIDFEKQLVRVELHHQNQTPRGQTANICQLRKENQQPMAQQQGNAEDLEDRNLSWLFNFKLDELPHLSPEVSHRTVVTNSASRSNSNSNSTAATTPNQKAQDRRNSVQEMPESPQEKVVQKKPPFTYTELIEYALEDKSELTVSGIYQWISDRFPYYKSNDDRWKNSVRHNLSINPHFRKGSKAPQGAGHLWTIASRESEANNLAWEHKKQRLELFFKMEAAANLAIESERQNSRQKAEEEELLAATASIMLPEDQQQQQQQTQICYGDGNLITSHYFAQSEQDSQQIIYDTVEGSDDLCRVATEILSGVRRNVEVQIIHPSVVGFDTVIDNCYTTEDYLNPIPKDEIMQESGLRSQQARNEIGHDFFVAEEIDPVELGINMATEEVFFTDDFNHYFGHNIVA